VRQRVYAGDYPADAETVDEDQLHLGQHARGRRHKCSSRVVVYGVHTRGLRVQQPLSPQCPHHSADATHEDDRLVLLTTTATATAAAAAAATTTTATIATTGDTIMGLLVRDFHRLEDIPLS